MYDKYYLRLPLGLILSLFCTLLPLCAAVADNSIPEYSRAYDPARDPFTDGKRVRSLRLVMVIKT